MSRVSARLAVRHELAKLTQDSFTSGLEADQWPAVGSPRMPRSDRWFVVAVMFVMTAPLLVRISAELGVLPTCLLFAVASFPIVRSAVRARALRKAREARAEELERDDPGVDPADWP